MAKQRKVYRFRLEPTPAQEEGLKRIAGACRAVYNWGLERRKDYYAEHGKTLPYAVQNLELTGLKNRPGLGWLKEADSQALQESLRDLDRAFVNFFEKRARFPKFKRAKDERFAFRLPQRVKVEGQQVYCPKIGWIKLRLSRPMEGTTKSASFKPDQSGHWHVCLIQEFALPAVALPVPHKPVGVDLGLIDFATSSKQCHVCSAVNDELTLSDRVWSCSCGAVHHRDRNAALNLEAEGMRLVAAGQVETQNARGAARKTWEARPCGMEARIPRL